LSHYPPDRNENLINKTVSYSGKTIKILRLLCNVEGLLDQFCPVLRSARPEQLLGKVFVSPNSGMWRRVDFL
jgi:hypothetical protein